METAQGESASSTIRRLFEVGTVAGMSDGQLLDRFLARGAEPGEGSAEVAFSALVERHGPMVLRACRSRLGDEHDAEDAFQATFLILARKAASIREHESAASWLSGVARRVAACARRSASLRRAKERAAAARAPESRPDLDPDRSEVVPAILEEVDILPEEDRAPLRLCLLDGLTHEEAAAHLGWPVGTVKTRVRRAKGRLRARLARRGLAPSLGAIGLAMASAGAATIPAALARSTARGALQFAANPGLVSAPVMTLVELGLRSLIMTRWKIVALVFATVGVIAAGANGLARQEPDPPEKGKPAEARPVEKDATDAEKPDDTEARRVAQADRADDLKMEAADLEIFRMEVDLWKQRVVSLLKLRFELEDQEHKFRKPRVIPGESRDEQLNVLVFRLADVIPVLGEARNVLYGKSRTLVNRERQLRERARDLPWALQAEVLRSGSDPNRPGGEARPALDVERRLSDVERKLDLILNALEGRGREPGK